MLPVFRCGRTGAERCGCRRQLQPLPSLFHASVSPLVEKGPPHGDSEEHPLRMEEDFAKGGVGSTNASPRGQGWGAQLGGPHSCNPSRGDLGKGKVDAIKNKRGFC